MSLSTGANLRRAEPPLLRPGSGHDRPSMTSLQTRITPRSFQLRRIPVLVLIWLVFAVGLIALWTTVLNRQFLFVQHTIDGSEQSSVAHKVSQEASGEENKYDSQFPTLAVGTKPEEPTDGRHTFSAPKAKTVSPATMTETRAPPKEEVNEADKEDPENYIPFSSIEACAPSAKYYACDNDPTCLSDYCVYKGANITFADPYNWKRFWRTKASRRSVLKDILHRMEQTHGINRNKRLLMHTFNSGFSHLFGNWYCSLIANGIDVDAIKSRTLVLATDQGAIDYARALGFFTPTLSDLNTLKAWAELPIATDGGIL